VVHRSPLVKESSLAFSKRKTEPRKSKYFKEGSTKGTHLIVHYTLVTLDLSSGKSFGSPHVLSVMALSCTSVTTGMPGNDV
jgi:hypothetical protein